MSRPILIIKTGTTISSLKARGEDFEHWFANGLGLSATKQADKNSIIVCNLHEGEKLPDVMSIAGLIITGSPAYLTDLADWNYVGADYVRAAYQADIPQLGVCYGHQLIAWAFGGEVGFHPGGREIGTVPVQLESAAAQDQVFAQLPQRFHAQASHQQSVLRLPKSAVLLGGNEFEPNHAFRLGQTIWCTQFHPEFDADITRAYITERSADIAAEGLNPQQLLAAVQETPAAATILQAFMRACS